MDMTKTPEKPMGVWTQVNWRKLERIVFKLQKRIYQASSRGDVRAVRKLQKTLLNSHSAKMLVVRQVTQDNPGKNTTGIDGKTALTPKERIELVENLELSHPSKTTRRNRIPKLGKTEKPQGSRYKGMNPRNLLPRLGILTIQERAKQGLVKLALEPEWEAKFEPNSYGFRPGRSCMDAIEEIKRAIKHKSQYVLNAEIVKSFARINPQKLLNKINTFPKIRKQIKAWLKSGMWDNRALFPTQEEISHRDIISPLLANIALHGMEKVVNEFARTLPGNTNNNEKEITLVRYADYFVVLHPTLDVVTTTKALIEKLLQDIGLELKPEKTRITHTLDRVGQETPGFDFLDFNIRQYPVGKGATGKNPHGKPFDFKSYVKPSKKAVKAHYQKLAHEIDKLKSCQSQTELIKRLNPIITGWSKNYSKVNSAETFKELDHLLTLKLIAWAKARHLHKSTKRWIRKYFGTKGGSTWVFRVVTEGKDFYLTYHEDFDIQKFVQVQGETSPNNSQLTYGATWMEKSAELPTRVTQLVKKQKGKCIECSMYFTDEDGIEVDLLLSRSKGGKDTYSNIQLLHSHCHDIETRRNGTHDKSQVIEEPCDAKVSRTVLKPSHAGDSVT